MAKTNFENLRIYQLAEELGDLVWEVVVSWDYLPKDTIGKQLINSTPSSLRILIMASSPFIIIPPLVLNNGQIHLRRMTIAGSGGAPEWEASHAGTLILAPLAF